MAATRHHGSGPGGQICRPRRHDGHAVVGRPGGRSATFPRQPGQFTGPFSDSAAKIGQFLEHRRDPHIFPVHCRTSRVLPR